jgi:hypothetical protein
MGAAEFVKGACSDSLQDSPRCVHIATVPLPLSHVVTLRVRLGASRYHSMGPHQIAERLAQHTAGSGDLLRSVTLPAAPVARLQDSSELQDHDRPKGAFWHGSQQLGVAAGLNDWG